MLAVGVPGKTNAGVAFQKEMALTDRRNKLAQQVKTTVSQLIKKYAGTTGAGSTETVDKVYSGVTKQLTVETLTGSRPFRSSSSSAATMYVLMGVDGQAREKSVENAMRNSMKNDTALRQQLKAKRAQDEPAAELPPQAADR